MATASRLFKPLKVGLMDLNQRIGMAPLTRYRAADEHTPTDLQVEYYSQRASVPGTLLITEATFISAQHGGFDNIPGIYTDAQIEGWKKVTAAVHDKGSYIVLQLWALGRMADAEVAEREGITIKSSSAVQLDGPGCALEMTVQDIKDTIEAYATAAKNAMRAGFDAVELHAANACLIDQFIQDTVNQRADHYGGSIENRSRFAIEAVEAVAKAVGAEKTGIRLSPWSEFRGMCMADPVPQFSDVIRKLPGNLAYIHVVEPRISGSEDVAGCETDSNDFAIDLWDGPCLAAGGFTAQSAQQYVDERWPDKDVAIIFGRYFIANPDLPFRIKEDIALNPYDRSTFYLPESPVGYIDQPFSKQFQQLQASKLGDTSCPELGRRS